MENSFGEVSREIVTTCGTYRPLGSGCIPGGGGRRSLKPPANLLPGGDGGLSVRFLGFGGGVCGVCGRSGALLLLFNDTLGIGFLGGESAVAFLAFGAGEKRTVAADVDVGVSF